MYLDRYIMLFFLRRLLPLICNINICIRSQIRVINIFEFFYFISILFYYILFYIIYNFIYNFILFICINIFVFLKSFDTADELDVNQHD